MAIGGGFAALGVDAISNLGKGAYNYRNSAGVVQSVFDTKYGQGQSVKKSRQYWQVLAKSTRCNKTNQVFKSGIQYLTSLALEPNPTLKKYIHKNVDFY